MRLTLLGAREIEQALDMDQAIGVNARAFMALSQGRAQTPERPSLTAPGGVGLIMPAYLEDEPFFSVKVVTVFPGNPGRGLATVQALLLVLDALSGAPLALLDGTRLTALRTGAASGAATGLLADPQARVLALLGAGGLAWDQARAVLAVRPIREIRIFTPSGVSAQTLALRLAQAYPAVRTKAVDSPGQAVAGAQVISCATTSRQPVFGPELVEPGTHINGVGSFTPDMREVPVRGLRDLKVFVDHRPAALAEAGELLQAMDEGLLDAGDLVEIGPALAGQAPGRGAPGDITFFKSVGVAVQDAATAQAVLLRARELGLGRQVEL